MKFQASSRSVVITIAIAIGVVVGRVHEPTQPEETTVEEKIMLGFDVETYTNTSIVGGQKSEAGEFPYFVDLTICAGTLIAPRVVITAAHCGPSNFIGQYVTVGAYKRDDKNEKDKRIQVIDGLAHPGYHRKKVLNNDFGLLLLERPYLSNTPIRLLINQGNKFLQEGDILKAIGMGTTSYQGSISDTLRDVDVPFVPRPQCRKSYSGRLTMRMMCAGEVDGGKDACQGDSGGPLVKREGPKHYLVGVTSWGRDCGKYPGVYSQVSKAENWIRKQVCETWNVGTPELCTKQLRAASASVCQDDPAFQYQGDSEKTCDWVREKPKLRCKLKVGERKVRKYCKDACEKCDD